MAGGEAGGVSLSRIFKGQWEPLMAFKPESNMLKCTSLEDYPDCKKESRLEERNDVALKFQYLVCLIAKRVKASAHGHPRGIGWCFPECHSRQG